MIPPVVIQILGWLAFVLALLALALGLRRKDLAGRVNAILLATAILVGTVHFLVPLPGPALDGTLVISFLLSFVVLWRLVRQQGG